MKAKRATRPIDLVTLKDDQLAAKYETADFGAFDVKEISTKDNQLRSTVFAEMIKGAVRTDYPD